MSVHQVYGDLLTIDHVDAICHQVNCLTVRSHGLSRQIALKYHWADIYQKRRPVAKRNFRDERCAGYSSHFFEIGLSWNRLFPLSMGFWSMSKHPSTTPPPPALLNWFVHDTRITPWNILEKYRRDKDINMLHITGVARHPSLIYGSDPICVF